jgi:hypothetical protein
MIFATTNFLEKRRLQSGHQDTNEEKKNCWFVTAKRQHIASNLLSITSPHLSQFCNSAKLKVTAKLPVLFDLTFKNVQPHR